MKKLNENTRLLIYQSIASLFAILTFVFLFIPAYFRSQPEAHYSLFDLMLGGGKYESSTIMILGFILLIVGIIVSIALAFLIAMRKANEKIECIGAVTSIATMLIGGVIMSCGIFLSGFAPDSSFLTLNQGLWGIEIGNILVPVFMLIAVGFSYPCALIILHHKDLEDRVKAKA